MSSSRAGRYKRLADMWLSFAACFLPVMVALWVTGAIRLDGFLDPKSLYLTPGLWDRHGWAFWHGFLFETPFALGRGFSGLLWVAIIGMYAYFGIVSWLRYRQTLAHA